MCTHPFFYNYYFVFFRFTKYTIITPTDKSSKTQRIIIGALSPVFATFDELFVVLLSLLPVLPDCVDPVLEVKNVTLFISVIEVSVQSLPLCTCFLNVTSRVYVPAVLMLKLAELVALVGAAQVPELVATFQLTGMYLTSSSEGEAISIPAPFAPNESVVFIL